MLDRRGRGSAIALFAVTGSVLFALGLFGAQLASAKTSKLVFPYDGSTGANGSPQYWVVPPKVFTAKFSVFGAQGGSIGPNVGGKGGQSSATLLVKPGQRLRIDAGGMPREATAFYDRGGWNGGAAAGIGAGGGGGASDIRRAPYHLSDRLLISGGGGGGTPDEPGGAGGGIDGADGTGVCYTTFSNPTNDSAGGGATQSTGGAGGGCDSNGNPGIAGLGGAGKNFGNGDGDGGGGGGGGLYGGGGGSPGGTGFNIYPLAGGGGGGSGFGPSGAVLRTGRHAGDGVVKISFAPNCSSGSPCVLPASAPTRVIASPGDRKARVSFAVPSHGTPIIHYRVTASPGGAHASGGTAPITVKGLKNGTSYRFRVTATNVTGTGPPSSPSNQVTPSTVLAAPTGVTAIPGNAQALVGFTPPAHRHALPRSVFYTVTASPGGRTARGAGSPIEIAGLTNGTTYTFTVTATNDIGPSAPSQPSNAVTALTIPGSPTSVIAVAGDGQANVAFSPPSANGAPISKYTVTASSGGASATGTGSPITVTGLTDGIGYTFTVTATNSVGTGAPSSASNLVIPVGPPGAPTGVTAVVGAGAGSASVSFTAPASNGAPITGYTVTGTSSNGGVSGTATGTTSPISVTGLSSFKLYTFTVTATNSLGIGPASAPSGPISTR